MNSLKVRNYAGRPIYTVLGFIWLVWAAVVCLLGFWQFALAVTFIFFLGLLDDLYGTGQSKGFRGHLRALKKGQVTTGFIKLFGISLVSFVWALFEVGQSAITSSSSLIEGRYPFLALASSRVTLASIAVALIAGAAIALTSNFMNLMDLRPGRAIKGYLALVMVWGLLWSGIGSYAEVSRSAMDLPGLFFDSVTAVTTFLYSILFVLAPMLLVLPFDLREKAMLGDGGANAAGFVAGALIVTTLPIWALVAYLLLIFALNIASEKISYSKAIERNSLLRRIDNIGRLENDEQGQQKRATPS